MTKPKNIKKKTIATITYSITRHFINLYPPIKANKEVTIKTIPLINKLSAKIF